MSKILTNEQLLTLKFFSGYQYSPEKKKIVYLASQSNLKENKSFKELFIMNLDGTDIKLISEPNQQIAQPTFVLGGEKIVYIQGGKLSIMNIDGSGKKPFQQIAKLIPTLKVIYSIKN